MHIVITIIGLLLVFAVLLDAFETVVLPRRVRRQYRLTSWFYRRTWIPWRAITAHIASASRREYFLAFYGPLSLILLLALWAAGLIFGFSLLQYGAGEHVQLSGEPITFGRLIYHSGETFFTLGYGDIVPVSAVARALAVIEAGMGFGFLGAVIGYLPTIYSSFSRREIGISLLDARAGSPPTATELLARFGSSPQQIALNDILIAMGTLGRRGPGEPHLIPGAEFLSFPAHQSILAGSVDRNSRHLRADHRWSRRNTQ